VEKKKGKKKKKHSILLFIQPSPCGRICFFTYGQLLTAWTWAEGVETKP